MTIPPLGIIEGYFGNPWSNDARIATMQALAPKGFEFFHFAPKGEARLRREWTQRFTESRLNELHALKSACAAASVRFGIGLSPFEAYLDFGDRAKAALTERLAEFDELGIDDLVILFDDMKSADLPDLAARQIEIIRFAAERTGASNLAVCPSYYSFDPVLDRVFGRRPEGYLQAFGALDPAIDIYWTGEEVCAREFSVGHLQDVAEMLRRKPLLWDNYPVNDGHRMSRYLHLRSFTGRPAGIADHIAGHAINPALQPVLSRVPAVTLAASYAAGPAYRYRAALADAADEMLGAELGEMVQADLLAFQDAGLDRIDASIPRLRERYAAIDHDGAREIVRWLDGGYAVSAEMVQTQ
ncbi:beta-N-acetylglucosaminidase domain-containing protein [Pacificimonas flava]|uniref:Hyaluronidase n=1 Tax=Pacificimonas flava TaxID=1234595 RepID=M2U136_9SPHN|nr:beta-N-acetylglucosaminidase domain-containing protein [Pacificimonas flava]EMD81712.1 Hyaluronidase [Pacificimonas flava]MBB5281715.1 hypothetical protein [Pacificimonas flava]